MEDKIINKRVGLGAGIGGLTGFLFGGPWGAAIGAAAGAALAGGMPQQAKRGEMTADRESVYHMAMNKEDASPEELDEIAAEFEQNGFSAEAEMIRSRASLRRLPPEILAQRKDIYRKAMTSDNPEEIREFASSFDAAHAFKGAESLKQHAAAVEAAHAAGKSCKPMADTKAIEVFGAKLAKAVTHFSIDSDEAKSAARNFIRARGIEATDEEVAKVLAAAEAELAEAAKEDEAAKAAAAAAPAGAPAGAPAAVAGGATT